MSKYFKVSVNNVVAPSQLCCHKTSQLSEANCFTGSQLQPLLAFACICVHFGFRNFPIDLVIRLIKMHPCLVLTTAYLRPC